MPSRAAGGRELRLPASGIELGYISLTAALAAIIGVAVVSLTPLLSDGAELLAANSSTAGLDAGAKTSLSASDPMRPALIHNLGSRLAVTSAVPRF